MFIYLAAHYREVLGHYLEESRRERGYKSRLAKAAGCHGSYLSQVLRGSVDLTAEQAMNLAAFWNLSPGETDYFLDLLQRDRAGSARLREYYNSRLESLRRKGDVWASRNRERCVLGEEARNLYYSSWHYAAVYILATTKHYGSVERMATRLHLTPALVKKTLRELEEMQLLQRNGEGWVDAVTGVYLPRETTWSKGHQVNWRLRAVANIQTEDPDSLHVVHLTGVKKEEVPRLKAHLLRAIEKIRADASESDAEDGVAITIDCFRI